MIIKLCGGDAAAGMKTLANSQGLVGILSLIINQAGGRFSDATGRKTGLLVGPLCNVVLGGAQPADSLFGRLQLLRAVPLVSAGCRAPPLV